ncbi:MAG: 4'-phosphopantetheinyl transferase superfamily protein [Clostridia bacterium]|nr:4'-phosphopantetheinyl transferase superfamily protein [Clostridia bacterium]
MIYLLDTRFLNLENKELYKDLPTERIDKINRLMFEEDKKLSLGAGLLLNFAVKDYCEKRGLNCPVFPLDIIKTEYGKPLLKVNAFDFNVSHSGIHVVCVVSEYSVGVDIQRLDNSPTDIHEKVMCEKETTIFGNDRESVLKVFCIKEAILKKTGVGLVHGLKNIELTCENNNIFSNKAILTPLNDDGVYSVEGLIETIFTINGKEKISVSTAFLEDKDGVYLIAQC